MLLLKKPGEHMKIRFGYVAMALNIPEDSPNKTVAVTSLMKISDQADRISRLRRLTRQILETQLRVLKYNEAHSIHVFRFTSRLVPLATHQEAAGGTIWMVFGKSSERLATI